MEQLHKYEILLVEDDQEKAELICENLEFEHLGMKVEWVENGRIALNHLLQKSYSFLLLDATLPDMHFFNLLQYLKKYEVSIPFMVLTEPLNDDRTPELQQPEALGYFEKSPGKVAELPAVIHDALSKLGEKQLTDFEMQRYIDLVEIARDAISFLDPNGVFNFVNGKAEEFTGYSREELIGKHISFLLKKDGEKLIRKELRKHKNVRWDKKFELEIKTKGHKLIPVELTISPFLKDRKLIGFEVIARDIRERKKAQKKLEERDAKIQRLNFEIQEKNMRLEESTRVQSEFVSNISHEFRTPLNGILGYSEILLDGIYGNLNDKQTVAITNIRNCASNLLELVQKIMDLSKLKSNQLQLELEYCSPHDLIEASFATVAPIARNKGLELRKKYQANLPPIHADFKRIYQVLVNLAGNAVKFTHQGYVEIGAASDPNGVRFYVSDTGIGIAPEDQEKIFHEFRQGDSSTTRLYGGIGVGLSLSKKLIELHGGDLKVDSKPEVGSQFYFTIPAGGH